MYRSREWIFERIRRDKRDGTEPVWEKAAWAVDGYGIPAVERART
ncbi:MULTISPECIES: hypothetical protein [Streptomyces]